MECNWLGCEDVDECLDKLVLCLTRHEQLLHSTRLVKPMITSPGPALSYLFYSLMAVSAPSVFTYNDVVLTQEPYLLPLVWVRL